MAGKKTSGLNTGNWIQPISYSTSITHQYTDNGKAYTVKYSNAYVAVGIYGGEYKFIMGRPSAGSYYRTTNGTRSIIKCALNLTVQSTGKKVYYAVATVPVYPDSIITGADVNVLSGESNQSGQVAYTIVYGDEYAGEKQDIPVQWLSPYTEKELSTSFKIDVFG